jgi:hypothetical protein
MRRSGKIRKLAIAMRGVRKHWRTYEYEKYSQQLQRLRSYLRRWYENRLLG